MHRRSLLQSYSLQKAFVITVLGGNLVYSLIISFDCDII